MATRGKGKRAIQNFIDSSVEFKHETLAGQVKPAYVSRGQLPMELYGVLTADEPERVLYSYQTPIAWYGKNGWKVPDIYYSRTTQNHQSIVRVAIDNPGLYAEARY